jgi:hypothetical protein
MHRVSTIRSSSKRCIPSRVKERWAIIMLAVRMIHGTEYGGYLGPSEQLPENNYESGPMKWMPRKHTSYASKRMENVSNTSSGSTVNEQASAVSFSLFLTSSRRRFAPAPTCGHWNKSFWTTNYNKSSFHTILLVDVDSSSSYFKISTFLESGTRVMAE